MEPATISALAALSGTIIGAASTIIMNIIQQKSETRRKLDEALIQGGITQWGKYFDAIIAGKIGKGDGLFYPPFVYMLCLSQFATIIHGIDKMSDKEIKLRIADAYRKIKLITDATEKEDLSTNPR